jgi:hypothetical protein
MIERLKKRRDFLAAAKEHEAPAARFRYGSAPT